MAQDEAGRLHDVLWMLFMALTGRLPVERPDDRTVLYGLHLRNDNRAGMPPLELLKAVCGPGDEGEPVITIMLPDEE